MAQWKYTVTQGREMWQSRGKVAETEDAAALMC